MFKVSALLPTISAADKVKKARAKAGAYRTECLLLADQTLAVLGPMPKLMSPIEADLRSMGHD